MNAQNDLLLKNDFFEAFNVQQLNFTSEVDKSMTSCETCSGFRVPNIIKSALDLTELFRKQYGGIFGPWCVYPHAYSAVVNQPSDHYFRSVCLSACLSVCLFVYAEFFQPSSIRFGSN